jgi:hypothetical protein
MHFENGVVASLKMLFTETPGRRINFFGTKGEIVFDEILDTIEVKPYFGQKQIYKLSVLNEGGWGHGGGDFGLINTMYGILTGEITDYTTLEESVESHLMGICAEKSRLLGGERVSVHN